MASFLLQLKDATNCLAESATAMGQIPRDNEALRASLSRLNAGTSIIFHWEGTINFSKEGRSV